MDVEVLGNTFWKSPHIIRCAIHENGYGFDKIHAHRVCRAPDPGITTEATKYVPRRQAIGTTNAQLGSLFRDEVTWLVSPV
jgi:hypothetical protein